MSINSNLSEKNVENIKRIEDYINNLNNWFCTKDSLISFESSIDIDYNILYSIFIVYSISDNNHIELKFDNVESVFAFINGMKYFIEMGIKSIDSCTDNKYVKTGNTKKDSFNYINNQFNKPIIKYFEFENTHYVLTVDNIGYAYYTNSNDIGYFIIGLLTGKCFLTIMQNIKIAFENENLKIEIEKQNTINKKLESEINK